MTRTWLTLAALVALALLGPHFAGTADAPDLAPAAAQLLPPGSFVEEAALAGGGFVRALEIRDDERGLHLRSKGEWREIPGTSTSGPVRTVRLWLGTDHQGRSLFARTLHGARTSLLAAAVATLVALALGTGVGLAAALSRRAIAGSVRIATDGLLGLPRLLLLLMLGAVLRGSVVGVGLAVGLSSWMEVSRLVEAEARSLRARPFVLAARASGAGVIRTAWGHVVPNLLPILAVAAPLIATEAILLESTLSFLGIGGGDSASWGRMVADGQRFLPGAWWLVCFPGLLLSLTAVAVHFLARPASSSS
jgi:peptide/nickel transport system permease protein